VAFDVAVYTDVVASEAVDGVDGFNFQAVSRGITGVDQQRIREKMLHRVIPAWSLGHDELSHPSTCAYMVEDGRSYLARGKSTGTTNSGRPGNQLTQAIVSSEPDDFIPYRPAQLYGAVNWTLVKAPTQEAVEWVTPLEIRPEFEVAALEKMVVDDDWAASVLPYYLTMIDEAVSDTPRKIVLLHADLDVVMRWIALGTLFVEQEVARTLSFRALVEDPWRVDAALVGVSPDFDLGDLSAANVLDLDRRVIPSVEASDAARVRAAWFIENGADDALNTMEVARRWDSVLGPGFANEAARVVGMPEEGRDASKAWRTSMVAIDHLAGAGLAEDLALYADEFCEAAVSFAPTTEDEFRLAGRAIRRAHDLSVDEVATGVLLPTLEALAAAPGEASGFGAELGGSVAPIEWGSADEDQAAGRFIGEILGGAPTESLPAVFAASWVIDVTVPDAALGPATSRLAELWLRDPSLGRAAWKRWLNGRAVLATVSGLLLSALRSGDNGAQTGLLGGEWDFLGEHVDSVELAGWLKAGRLGRVPAAERRSQIALAGHIPDEAWPVVLAGSKLPEHSELWSSWITHHGIPLDLAAAIMGAIRELFRDGPNKVDVRSSDWRPIMRSLTQAPDSELRRVASDYERGRRLIRSARDEVGIRPAARLDATIPYVRELCPLFLADVGWLLLNATNADAAAELMGAAEPWSEAAMLASLNDAIISGEGLRALGTVLRARTHRDEAFAATADAVLARLVAAHPRLVERARAHPRLQRDMDKYLKQQGRTRRGKRKHGGATDQSEER